MFSSYREFHRYRFFVKTYIFSYIHLFFLYTIEVIQIEKKKGWDVMSKQTYQPVPKNSFTTTFLHHRYSKRVKLLFSFLSAGVCETLFKEVTHGESIFTHDYEVFLFYPFLTALFFFFSLILNGKIMHRFVVTPFLYFVFGYSFASITKTLFELDINLFTLTYWVIGAVFVYSLLFRKFYTFTWFLFDSVMSIVFSFFIMFFLLTILVGFDALPESGGYLGIGMLVVFHICYLYFFRHRFSILLGVISLLFAFVGSIVAYDLLDSIFSPNSILHSLYGGFIFTSIYAVCISFFTLFTKQPKAFPVIKQLDSKPTEVDPALSWKKGPEVVYVKVEVDNSPPQYTGQHSSDYYDGYNDGVDDERRGY